MNTIEGNDLIKNFMQLQISKGVIGDSRVYYKIQLSTHEIIAPENDLQYHSSWDWLIPAIKKFMGIKNLEYKQLGKYNYWCIKIDDAVCSYDLQFTCATLINAIEWYNSEQSVKESDTSKAT